METVKPGTAPAVSIPPAAKAPMTDKEADALLAAAAAKDKALKDAMAMVEAAKAAVTASDAEIWAIRQSKFYAAQAQSTEENTKRIFGTDVATAFGSRKFTLTINAGQVAQAFAAPPAQIRRVGSRSAGGARDATGIASDGPRPLLDGGGPKRQEYVDLLRAYGEDVDRAAAVKAVVAETGVTEGTIRDLVFGRGFDRVISKQA
jgi:hypothetical protein